MKDKSIAPYIISHLKAIEKKRRFQKQGRYARGRSALFDLPECNSWSTIRLVSLVIQKGIDYKKIDGCRLHMNASMEVNELLLQKPAKIFCVLIEEVNETLVERLSESIASSPNDLVLLDSWGLAMSAELYYMAGGIDELLPEVEDAIYDLALRSYLLGGSIPQIETIKESASEIALRNVKKGRLVVNQGSALFR